MRLHYFEGLNGHSDVNRTSHDKANVQPNE